MPLQHLTTVRRGDGGVGLATELEQGMHQRLTGTRADAER